MTQIPDSNEALLGGIPICRGVAIGPIAFAATELETAPRPRIAKQDIEAEIARFRAAVQLSSEQIEQLAKKLGEELGAEELQILDVHRALLTDPTFLDDVERRIEQETRTLGDALKRVVRDFERVFELVEDAKLKEKALDLRDVALRVIRNVQDDGEAKEPKRFQVEGGVVLVCRKLSISDMLLVDREQILALLTEEGGELSHGAIFARTLGIPTLSGIPDLFDKLSEGETVIVDAGTGVVHRDPDERLLREYEIRAGAPRVETVFEDSGPAELGDGTRVQLYGACGNLGEVGQMLDAGLDGVGLYRTEFLYLVSKQQPTEEMLVHHYREVLARAEGRRVCFRLLSMGPGLPFGPSEDQADSSRDRGLLGLEGIRYLLHRPSLMRTQLRALLRTGDSGQVEIAVPFVTTWQDLLRVREAVRAERASLIKEGIPCVDSVRIGAVVEVPSTAFFPQTVAHEADFLIVAIDDLQQYLLAADRENEQVSEWYRIFHPALFLLLDRVAKQASELDKGVVLFGEGAADPLRLPFYLGAGYRHFAIAPVRSQRVRKVLGQWSKGAAEVLAHRVLDASSSLEVQRLLLEAER
ncbi:MAG: phosphoenolpyruvate--protein phosphotransferase [Planctomycetota bacterium]|nr:MAG: phosphoenolpyruvate--protein phosphotransferase [Planctomycetota bacterium]